MVTRFFYLLSLAFVLQMCAGVASAYCMHETGTASEHFGHHQHEHENAGGDDDNPTPAKKASYDPDCASCSNGSTVPLAWSAQIAPPLLAPHLQLAQPPRQPSPYLGLPERPNWTRAA